MNEQNTKALLEKYPNLFNRFEYNGKLMPFHFECGDGWYTIIDKLCALIYGEIKNRESADKYKRQNGETVEAWEYPQVVQVKEKFGGLRFYTYSCTDTIRGMISMAESMSYVTCEVCGNPGRSSEGGWIFTLCQPCKEKRDNRKL